MKYLTFDDVLIEPNYSDIESRSDISIKQKFLERHSRINMISLVLIIH